MTPAADVFEHVVLIRRKESNERLWALVTASYAWAERQARREIWQDAKRHGEVGLRRRSAFELLATDEDRVCFIGAELKCHGDRWAQRHVAELAWLEARGVSRQEAIRKHNEWMAAQLAHPQFTPARRSKE